MASQSLSRVRQHVKLSDVSLGTHPRYSVVADEDVKKPIKQTNNYLLGHYGQCKLPMISITGQIGKCREAHR